MVEALELEVELRKLVLHGQVGRVRLHRALVIVHGLSVVVRCYERAADLARQGRVLAVLPVERALECLDRLLRLLDLHESLPEHHVGLHVGVLLHQIEVAARVHRLVVAMLEVDVGHRHLCAHVVGRVARDGAEHAQAALDVPAAQRELAIGDHHAHLLGRARELVESVLDDLGRLWDLAQLRPRLGEEEVDGDPFREGHVGAPLAPGLAHPWYLHAVLEDLQRLVLLHVVQQHLGFDDAIRRGVPRREVLRGGLVEALPRQLGLVLEQVDLSHEYVRLREVPVDAEDVGDCPGRVVHVTSQVVCPGEEQLAFEQPRRRAPERLEHGEAGAQGGVGGLGRGPWVGSALLEVELRHVHEQLGVERDHVLRGLRSPLERAEVGAGAVVQEA
mmetsp:Transcript_26566/g.85184  ORF Transcript_26566/g.85184 Transcript_26566/m.85184 type:complete len:389 (-) Transcript_26566:1446-2612(-)